MLRILSTLFTYVPIVLALIFAGVILDVGLTSIYAHFGWELWPTMTVIGAIIGLIRGISDEHWRLPAIAVFAIAGYVLAKYWLVDGVILSVVIIVIYSSVESRFNEYK